MNDAWFTGLADELAQCLLDAETCAEACEHVLDEARRSTDGEIQQTAVDALVAPAAVARILIELIDHPPRLVLAACRLYCDSAVTAVERLEALGPRLETAAAIAALRTASASCERLLEAAAG